jgi:hypothetical protein
LCLRRLFSIRLRVDGAVCYSSKCWAFSTSVNLGITGFGGQTCHQPRPSAPALPCSIGSATNSLATPSLVQSFTTTTCDHVSFELPPSQFKHHRHT